MESLRPKLQVQYQNIKNLSDLMAPYTYMAVIVHLTLHHTTFPDHIDAIGHEIGLSLLLT